VSSYVYMKVLESAPARYDRGIRILSGGRIAEVYRRIAELAASPGARVLDVGCGTGGVSLACAARGARVVGIDRDAGMLEIARAKPVPGGAAGVEWVQIGAAEIEDRFDERSFESVVSCLVLSELSADERRYVLATARTRLVPGGRLVVADEMLPAGRGQRLWYRVKRAPLVAITWALTNTTTRPIERLADEVGAAGFEEVDEERPAVGFGIVSARRPS
jgi:demethylmenaquinone methyltransferase/2-methoxy-6-polyprenyl-1,4-benzoquinol methylase